MATSYLIRVDGVRDESQKITDWIRTQGSSLGVYECVGDNSHYHFWLKSEKSIATLRANFKRYFPEKVGNKSYSLKAGDGNLNYLCKGERCFDHCADYDNYIPPDIVINTLGVTESQIKDAQRQYWRDNDKFNSKKEKKVEDQKKMTSQFEKALQYCKEKGINCSSDGWQIVKCLINYYRINVKCEPNDFQLKLMAKSIATHLVYEAAEKHDCMHVYESYLETRAKEVIGTTWTYPSWPQKIISQYKVRKEDASVSQEENRAQEEDLSSSSEV